MTVKLIKLMNGEEICAKVKEENDTTITIEKPAIVMLAPNQKGNLAVQMGPYCPHTDNPLPINKAHIVYSVEPGTELLNGYNKAFGSGLVMPSPAQILKG